MYKVRTDEAVSKIANADTSNANGIVQVSHEVGNSDLWKIYGRESEAGKMLFKLFGKGPNSIKVDYPKPKTQKKPLPHEVTRVKTSIPPPQKTVIEYPTIPQPWRKAPKVHAVDLIPHRKLEVEIRKEIDEFYSKPVVPLNKGVNRKKMIDELQAKFKKQRGALPKGAELPALQQEEVLAELSEEEIKQRALKKINKKHLTYTYEKPKKEEKGSLTKTEQEKELDNLYQEIEEEINERQNYLQEIRHLDEPAIKEKVKKEIIERVAELQKIIKMMRNEE